jgi:hypothetical protein
VATVSVSVRKLRSVVEAGRASQNWVDQAVDIEQFASSMLPLGTLHHEMCEPVEACAILDEAATLIQTVNTSRPCATLVGLQEVARMLSTCLCAPVA